MKRAIFAWAFVALAGCGDVGFDPPSLVNTLRVLAVRAEPSFARPGERVHLETLVADPNGGGRSVSFAWSTCLNPGSTEVSACAAIAAPFSIGGPTLDVDVPSNALDGLSASDPNGSLGVLFAACAGRVTAEPTATAPVSCFDARGARVGRDGFMWGEKRITTSAGERNANPQIATITLDGADWSADAPPGVSPCGASDIDSCPPEQRHVLAIRAPAGSAESYGNGLTEDLVAFFFVSQGKVDNDFVREDGGAFSVRYAATGADPSRPILVWVVLRDDRGGVDWVERSLGAR